MRFAISILTVAVSVVVSLLSSAASAQTYTLYPSRDSYISRNGADTNYGTETRLLTKGGSTDNYFSVLHFSLVPIPFDERITSAVLRLKTVSPGGSPETYTLSAHNMTDTWAENTVTWNNTSTDYTATAAGTGSASAGAVMNINITSLATAWAAGTTVNNGVLLNGTTLQNIEVRSKEFATISERPVLTITTTTIPVFTAATNMLPFSDPSNLTANPKRIPGAIIRTVGSIANTGRGAADAGATTFTLGVPSQSTLFVGDLGAVGSGPVIFTQGSPTSGTTFTYSGPASTVDSVAFSADGTTFNYTPVPSADGYDPNVKSVRITTSGTFAGATGAGNPSYTAEIRSRLN